jgi:hypothetical protein
VEFIGAGMARYTRWYDEASAAAVLIFFADDFARCGFSLLPERMYDD